MREVDVGDHVIFLKQIEGQHSKKIMRKVSAIEFERSLQKMTWDFVEATVPKIDLCRMTQKVTLSNNIYSKYKYSRL